MLEIAKSLRTEFYESGEVSTETKKRLKEVLEDKNKREKFAEVLSKEVEEVPSCLVHCFVPDELYLIRKMSSPPEFVFPSKSPKVSPVT